MYLSGVSLSVYCVVADMKALKELRNFLIVDGSPLKIRQKLLRNFRARILSCRRSSLSCCCVWWSLHARLIIPCETCSKLVVIVWTCWQIIDMLVRILQQQMTKADEDIALLNVSKASFDVIHAYLMGASRKNKLYFLKYLHFFQHQFNARVSRRLLSLIFTKVEFSRHLLIRILCFQCYWSLLHTGAL
jgi:hypothetical protein